MPTNVCRAFPKLVKPKSVNILKFLKHCTVYMDIKVPNKYFIIVRDNTSYKLTNPDSSIYSLLNLGHASSSKKNCSSDLRLYERTAGFTSKKCLSNMLAQFLAQCGLCQNIFAWSEVVCGLSLHMFIQECIYLLPFI